MLGTMVGLEETRRAFLQSKISSQTALSLFLNTTLSYTSNSALNKAFVTFNAC